MAEEKRLFIGGLVESVTVADVEARFQKFGKISGVEIKIKDDILANQKKTFAYVNISISDESLTKCMKLYHKSKWRGKELQIQVAKDSFMHRLQKERAAAMVEPEEDPDILRPDDHDKIKNMVIKSTSQGTPVENMKNWVVGKRGEVLPVVYIRRKDKKKVMKMDPSNYINNNIVMDGTSKNSELDAFDTSVEQLTWQLEERKEKHKQEIARESPWKPSEKSKKSEAEIALGNKWQNLANGYKEVESLKNHGRLTSGAIEFDSDDNEDGNDEHLKHVKNTVTYNSDDSEDTGRPKKRKKPKSHSKIKSQRSSLKRDANFKASDDEISESELVTAKMPKRKIPLKKVKSENESDSSSSEGGGLGDLDLTSLPHWLASESEESDSPNASKLKEYVKLSIVKRSKPLSKNNTVSKTTPFKVKSIDGKPVNLLTNSDSDSDSSASDEQLKRNTIELSDSESDSSESDIQGNIVRNKTQVEKSDSKSDSNMKMASNTSKKLLELSTMEKLKLLSKDRKSTPIAQTSKGKIPVKNSNDGEKVNLMNNSESDSDSSESDDQPNRNQTKKSVNLEGMSDSDSDSSDSDLPDKKILFEKSESESDSSESDEEPDRNITKKSDSESDSSESDIPRNRQKTEKSDSESDSESDRDVQGKSTTCRDYDSSDDTDSKLTKLKSKEKSQTKIKLERSLVSQRNTESSDEEDVVVKVNMSPKKRTKKVERKMVDASESASGLEDTSLPRWLDSESDSEVEMEKSHDHEIVKTSQSAARKRLQDISIEKPRKMAKVDTTGIDGGKSSNNRSILDEFSSGFQDSLNGDGFSESEDEKMDIFDLIKCGKIGSILNKDSKSKLKKSNTEKSDKKINESPIKIEKQGKNSTKTAKRSVDEMKVVVNPEEPERKKAKKEKKKIVLCTAEKKILANDKRLESLKQRQMETKLQKSAVQKALKSVDSEKSSNKKILFDSDDDDTAEITSTVALSSEKTVQDLSDSDSSSPSESEERESKNKKKNKKPILFNDDSSDDEESDDDRFKIRPEFEGKAGGKLLKLQSRFANDTRFKMDKRFADSESESEDQSEHVPEPESLDTEKLRALEILKTVVGERAVMSRKHVKKTFKDINALHYDPLSENHEQFEIVEKKKDKPVKSKKKKREAAQEEIAAEDLPEVSKERFFEVTTSLKNLFEAPKGDEDENEPFSLLSTFGREVEEQHDKGIADATDISNPTYPWEQPVFSVSKDSSDEEMHQDEKDTIKRNAVSDSSVVKVLRKTKETFFLSLADPEIQESLAFFTAPADKEEMRENWLEKRPALVEAYRMKRKRSLRQSRVIRRSFANKSFANKSFGNKSFSNKRVRQR